MHTHFVGLVMSWLICSRKSRRMMHSHTFDTIVNHCIPVHHHLSRIAQWCFIECYASLITRKPVFGVSDQVRLKPARSATEARQRLEISDIETRGIILYRQRTTMRRLICTPVVCIWLIQIFPWRGSCVLHYRSMMVLHLELLWY